MLQAVEHLAELTGFRDRDVLDVSLATTLRELLTPLSVAVYRCVGDPDAQHWILRARITPQDLIATADPLWVDIASLPRVSDLPDRQACLLSRRVHSTVGASTRTFFPLGGGVDVQGVVEIETDAPLGTESVRMVGSMLRVFRNFQDLLDYSERDMLTGLLNRKTFDNSFLRLMSAVLATAVPMGATPEQRHQPDPGVLCLAVIDIDHFKRVNDNFGHLIGDEVLLLMSRLMRSSFRFQDQLYRFGGEEFVVLMRCAQGPDAAVAFERLRSNVERYVFPQVGHITISAGFTELRPNDSPTAAFDRADKAVYYAKQNGRNQIHHHAALVAAGKLVDESHDSDVELF